MIRVCFITHYPQLYGANKSLLNILDSLLQYDEQLKLDVSILIPSDGEIIDELNARKIKTIIVPFEPDWYNPRSLKAILARRRRIASRLQNKQRIIDLIRKINPDIIHTNSSVTNLGALAAAQLDVPHIWHVREDVRRHYKWSYDNSRQHYLQMRNASKIIATSEYIKDMLKQLQIKNSEVMYNLVGKGCSKKISKCKEIVLGVVGLLDKNKNQVFILKSLIPLLKIHSEIKLHFYGGGNRRILRTLQNIISRNEKLASQIALKGHISIQDEIYPEIDILINMSEFEAFGRVNLEAYSYGIPVIGLKSGATVELIKSGVTGILIDKSEKQLREAIIKLLNKDIRRAMGQKALEFYEKINKPQEYARHLLKIYQLAIMEHKDHKN